MPDLTSTDLLVAAAIIDVHGGTRLQPLADRLAQAAAQMEPTETETTSSDPTRRPDTED